MTRRYFGLPKNKIEPRRAASDGTGGSKPILILYLFFTHVSPEVAAAITRLTRGNFRLLTRLLTQMQRVVEINQLSELSIDVVETARENLVIGQA